MRTLNRGLLCLTESVLALGLSMTVVAQDGSVRSKSQSSEAQLMSQPAPEDRNRPDAVLAAAELPDSPGATQAQSQNSSPQQNGSTAPAKQTGSQPAQNSTRQEQRPQRPV